MKTRYLSILILLLSVSCILAQNMMRIHTTSGDVDYVIANIDSITFYEDSAPTNGLIAYYRFNIDGTANDESGNEYNGTLLGNALIDNGVLFTGNNASDALSLPYEILDGKSDFTISAMVQILEFHTDNGNHWITGTRSDQLGAFNTHYGHPTQQWAISFDHDSRAFDIDNTVEDGNWHHVVILREADKARLYMDGIQSGNEIDVSTDIINLDPDGLILGQEQDAVGGGFQSFQSFAGKTDNLRFYNRALTNEEIQAVYATDGFGY